MDWLTGKGQRHFFRRAPNIVMPGLVPLLSGSDLGDRAHGLDSTGFRGVRRDRDSDRRPAAQPCSRHTRTCSGYLSQAAPPGGRMDTRNKSGYDERGRSGLSGKGRIADAARPRNPRRPPVQIRPMAEPDSSGLVPGIQAAVRRKRWREIPGTSPGMTERRFRHGAGRRWRRRRPRSTPALSSP